MFKKVILYSVLLLLSAAAIFAAGKYLIPAISADSRGTTESENNPTVPGTGPDSGSKSTETEPGSTGSPAETTDASSGSAQTSGTQAVTTAGTGSQTTGNTGTASGTTVPSVPGETSLPGGSTDPGTTTPGASETAAEQGLSPDTYIYPLKVSENGRYLIDQNGKPFYPVVDTGWMVFSYIDEEDAEYYLEQRRLHGVNTILCYGAPFILGTPNADGEVAFFNDDLSKPNDKYWDYVEHLIGVMADKGMQVIMGPCEMYQYREQYSTEDAAALGRYMGKRFKDVKNLMWFTGGDVHPTQEQIIYSDALAKGILEFDTGHLISFHPAGGNASSDYFNSYDWLDYDMVQVFTPDSPKSYSLMLDAYGRKPARPVILIEPCYEDNGDNSTYQVRRAISWGVTSGGFGAAYGSKIIYKYIPPDWKEYLDRPAFIQFADIAAMLREHDWFLLEPDTSGKLIKSGKGRNGAVDYASVSLASDGSFAIAYLPTSRNITIDLSIFNGEKTVKWFDPTNNTYVEVGKFASSGTQSLKARPANSDGKSDWFLIID